MPSGSGKASACGDGERHERLHLCPADGPLKRLAQMTASSCKSLTSDSCQAVRSLSNFPQEAELSDKRRRMTQAAISNRRFSYPLPCRLRFALACPDINADLRLGARLTTAPQSHRRKARTMISICHRRPAGTDLMPRNNSPACRDRRGSRCRPPDSGTVRTASGCAGAEYPHSGQGRERCSPQSHVRITRTTKIRLPGPVGRRGRVRHPYRG